mmetsp:Transcript_17466/g.48454  ORF Transcript_17466/g.48454 Transcript_17466/m.48454 type:complete len:217 (+) Transcript_17466:2293-2943(+)
MSDVGKLRFAGFGHQGDHLFHECTLVGAHNLHRENARVVHKRFEYTRFLSSLLVRIKRVSLVVVFRLCWIINPFVGWSYCHVRFRRRLLRCSESCRFRCWHTLDRGRLVNFGCPLALSQYLKEFIFHVPLRFIIVALACGTLSLAFLAAAVVVIARIIRDGIEKASGWALRRSRISRKTACAAAAAAGGLLGISSSQWHDERRRLRQRGCHEQAHC